MDYAFKVWFSVRDNDLFIAAFLFYDGIDELGHWADLELHGRSYPIGDL